MSLYECLIVIYFTLNGLMTGFDYGEGGRSWYFILIGIFLAIPIVLFILIRDSINEKLIIFKWYNDLIFWFQLNITDYWKDLDNCNNLEKFIHKSGDERVKSQWERIKKKYGYLQYD